MSEVQSHPLYLVIDAGSSSIRAVLYDNTLGVVAAESTPHRFDASADGGVTCDADELRAHLEGCIDRMLGQLRTQPALARGAAILAVGCSTFVGNVLGIDGDGQPVTPISTYADTRAHDTLEKLVMMLDAVEATRRTGCPMHTAYHPARIRWLTDHGAHAEQWIDFLTYCYRRWFGRPIPCSYSVASWSGLLNRADLTWDAEWLRVLGLTEHHLPPLADMDATQVGLAAPFAERWPELAKTPFYLAIGDGAAANIGVGAANGEIALSIGTTAALRRVRTEPLPPVPHGLWGYRVTADRHLIGGATSEGGSVYAWASSVLQVDSTAELEALERRADQHGLIFLPFLAGERSPGYRADATGSFHGLRLSTTAPEMLQAALEGVALRLAIIADGLDPARERPVYASGGALTASRAWQQITADALNRTVRVFSGVEASARGIAALTRQYETGVPVTEGTLTPATVIEPRPAYATALQAARTEQARLYSRLWMG
jgi:gluconokinase